MKKLLPLLIILFAFGKVDAQQVPNGGFENWNSAFWSDPANYNTSNDQLVPFLGAAPNVVEVDGWTSGVKGVKMTTVAIDGDTIPGYFTNSIDNPLNGNGGIPYTQKPVAIEIWYNCNIVPGDTAVWGVVFKKGGFIIGVDLFKVTGTVTGYPALTKPLLPLGNTPDTVIFAAISSQGVLYNKPGFPGSTFTISGVEFKDGSNTTINPTLLNGDFTSWVSDSILTGLQGWNISTENSFRTTDAFAGNYALALVTLGENGGAQPAVASTGGGNTIHGPVFLQPYNQQIDTLQFYYSFTSSVANADSAGVVLQFKVGGFAPGYAYILPPTTGYQLAKIPISLSGVADSSIVSFFSYYSSVIGTNVSPLDAGATLLVDDVQFLSQPLITGAKPVLLADNTLLIYPNPATNQVTVSSSQSSINEIRMENMLGETVLDNHFAGGSATTKQNVDVGKLTSGLYLISITSGGKTSTGKITVGK